jgi:enamine deaminase RidA (YjgF/YER057c/UK114 family)
MNPDQLIDSITTDVRYPLEISLVQLTDISNGSYVSGQVAMRNGSLVATGLVGREVSLEKAQECARQCAINVLRSMKNELGTLSKIKRISRIAVYVSSADGFTDQHLVAHGASQLFIEVLGKEIGAHSRTAIGVKSLPLDSPVEVDAIVQL